MTLKEKLLSKGGYIINSDCFKNLSMDEICLLSYIIDIADFHKTDDAWMELTPSYIQLKRPGWKANSIRYTLNKLVAKNLILKHSRGDEERPDVRYSGRGASYKLNLEAINNLMNE